MIKETFKLRTEFDIENSLYSPPSPPASYSPYFLDPWSVSPFYGKVDERGLPVVPRGSFMRAITTGKDPSQQTLLQIVVEDVFALRKEYESFQLNGTFAKSKYFKKSLLPVFGFQDSSGQYMVKLQETYSNFVDYLISSSNFNKVKNMGDFIELLLGFLSFKKLYLTRAGFVESVDYSLLSTGLYISYLDEKSSNDKARLQFFQDKNYEAFIELCTRHNFKVDREIPWRIVYDIRTKKFVERYNKINPSEPILAENNLKQVFDKYYRRVVPIDKESFQYFTEFVIIVLNFYNNFSSSFPEYKKSLINECGLAEMQVFKRTQNTETHLSYDRKTFLNYYLTIRNIELKYTTDRKVLESIKNISIASMNISKNEAIDSQEEKIVKAINMYTNNIGTLAHRSPTLLETVDKKKMIG